MTVALLPAYVPHTMGSSWVPLDEAPNYVRSPHATRWHRPRSGRRYHTGRVSYDYWCGANFGDGGVESIGADEQLCATCEGRFAAQQENQLRFDPIKSQRPKLCPASGRWDMVPSVKARSFRCPVCGKTTAWRAGRWYDDGAKVVRHTPGDGLVDPCRWHGWNQLVLRDGDVACACGQKPP